MNFSIGEITLEKAKRTDILVLLSVSLSWISYSILKDTFGYPFLIVPITISIAGLSLLIYLRKIVGPF